MEIEERIEAFTILGNIFDDILNGQSNIYSERVNVIIDSQQNNNPWFTPENVRSAIRAVSNELTSENLKRWTSAYPAIKENHNPSRVAVIMAGNIPMVGFHDFLSVLITGNKLLAKTSSKDSELIVISGEILSSIRSDFSNMIEFTSDKLGNFDAVIATGSDNSSRYFEYYFSKYPNIIRHNRTSVAILTGLESEDELLNLGKDVFLYYGLGCRNVSKLFLPRGYDLSLLSSVWEPFSGVIKHNKYANNYDFNKAVFLVNKDDFYDSGYILFKEDNRLSSPVAVLYYELYDTLSSVYETINQSIDKIQCIVDNKSILFGKSQTPKLWDYADGIDTIEFLLKKDLQRL